MNLLGDTQTGDIRWGEREVVVCWKNHIRVTTMLQVCPCICTHTFAFQHHSSNKTACNQRHLARSASVCVHTYTVSVATTVTKVVDMRGVLAVVVGGICGGFGNTVSVIATVTKVVDTRGVLVVVVDCICGGFGITVSDTTTVTKVVDIGGMDAIVD